METAVARRFRRGDIVYVNEPGSTWSSRGILGEVRRSARDGTWVDVLWRTGYATWTARMRAQTLTLKEAKKTPAKEATHVHH